MVTRGSASPEVSVLDRQRSARVSTVRVAAFGEFALRRLRRPGSRVTVVLVGDRAMRELNRRWRGVDRTTDVLSFPQLEGPGGGLHPEELGDVAISVPTARRQAAAAGHCLMAELDRLLVHGLLHLLGHEHEGDAAGARAMRRREASIIRGWRA